MPPFTPTGTLHEDYGDDDPSQPDTIFGGVPFSVLNWPTLHDDSVLDEPTLHDDGADMPSAAGDDVLHVHAAAPAAGDDVFHVHAAASAAGDDVGRMELSVRPTADEASPW